MIRVEWLKESSISENADLKNYHNHRPTDTPIILKIKKKNGVNKEEEYGEKSTRNSDRNIAQDEFLSFFFAMVPTNLERKKRAKSGRESRSVEVKRRAELCVYICVVRRPVTIVTENRLRNKRGRQYRGVQYVSRVVNIQKRGV
jgi:hypothetical protein